MLLTHTLVTRRFTFNGKFLFPLNVVVGYLTHPKRGFGGGYTRVVTVEVVKQPLTNVPTPDVNPLTRIEQAVDAHLVRVQCFDVLSRESPRFLFWERHNKPPSLLTCKAVANVIHYRHKQAMPLAGHTLY